MDKFSVIAEDTDECEWVYFDGANDETCTNAGAFAIEDPDEMYECVDGTMSGIHIYHLCPEHIDTVLDAINGDD